MSEPAAKKKDPAQLPAEFRALVRVAPKLGDRRTVTKRFKKGESVSFVDYEAPFIFEATTLMEVDEEYKKLGEYNTPGWHVISYSTVTARRVPSIWRRLKLWLFGERSDLTPQLPEARTVRRG